MAPLTAYASGITDFFIRALRMAFFAESIGKVNGVEILSGEKSQCHNTEPQYRAAQIMVVNERDILYVPAPFRNNGIINNKIAVLQRILFNVESS